MLPSNWRKKVLWVLVFFLVSGACLGTRYREHDFEIRRWVIDVVSAGVVPTVFFGMALAIESLPVAAGVMGACLVGAMVVFIYLPFAWLVLIDYGWNGYRLTWLAMWPVLPGGLLALLPRFVGIRLDGSIGLAVAGMATLGLIALASWTAQRGRWATVVAALAALAIAGLTSLAAHAIFRA